jgi:hypothetical protein
MAGNQPTCHESLEQAALAGRKPIFGSVLEGHPEGGGAGQGLLGY